MKHLFSSILLLLLAVAGYADTKTLTVYTDGCSTPTTVIRQSGQGVYITAVATLPNSQFDRWSDGNTSNPRLLVMTETITAYFKPIHFTLTLYANGCATPNLYTIPNGQQVSVSAEETIDGSHFIQWSDGNTDNPRLLSMTQDTTLTAQYSSDLTLVDATAYDKADSEVWDVTYQRTITHNDWNMLYVPVALDIEDLLTNHDIQIYALNMLHQYDDDRDGSFERMTLEVLELQSGNTLPSHPYLFKYTGALTEQDRLDGKDLSIDLGLSTLEAAASYHNALRSMSFEYDIHGTYEAIPQATAANYYTLVWNDALNGCVFDHPATDILAQRWYFVLNALMPQYTTLTDAPIRIVVAGKEADTPTGIDATACDETAAIKLLENGQLVIIRDSRAYDTLGRLLH